MKKTIFTQLGAWFIASMSAAGCGEVIANPMPVATPSVTVPTEPKIPAQGLSLIPCAPIAPSASQPGLSVPRGSNLPPCAPIVPSAPIAPKEGGSNAQPSIPMSPASAPDYAPRNYKPSDLGVSPSRKAPIPLSPQNNALPPDNGSSGDSDLSLPSSHRARLPQGPEPSCTLSPCN